MKRSNKIMDDTSGLKVSMAKERQRQEMTRRRWCTSMENGRMDFGGL